MITGTSHLRTSIEVVLEHTARLRSLWVARGRTGFVSVLDKKLFAVFTERYSKVLGTYVNDRNATYDLYVALLTEMKVANTGKKLS